MKDEMDGENRTELTEWEVHERLVRMEKSNINLATEIQAIKKAFWRVFWGVVIILLGAVLRSTAGL